MLLPPRCFHRFEKEFDVGFSSNSPLIGVQCTSILLGHDEATATDNLRSLHTRGADWRRIMLARAADARTPMQADLPLYLGLFCCGAWHKTTDCETDPLQIAHRQALRPFVQQAVDAAEKMHDALGKYTKQDLLDQLQVRPAHAQSRGVAISLRACLLTALSLLVCCSAILMAVRHAA